jgi:hypothetical protein
MKSRASKCLLAIAIFALVFVIPVSAQNKTQSQAQSQTQTQNQAKPDSTDEGVSGTVEGLVRDIACPIQVKRTTATNFNLECALECAKNGSPLIILTKAGTIYTPISDSMPDKSQRERLMPFVGKFVKVTGQLYEREGAHAIAIKEISEMKEVHLITDAK